MSKGPTGVENPVLYVTIPTKDGRWMVSACADGKGETLPGFLGSEEDAETVARVLNERELARYQTESLAAIGANFKPRSFKEIAEELSIPWVEK